MYEDHAISHWLVFLNSLSYTVPIRKYSYSYYQNAHKNILLFLIFCLICWRWGSCQHIFLYPLTKIANLHISWYFVKCIDKLLLFSTIFHSDLWLIGSDSLVSMFSSLWQKLKFLEQILWFKCVCPLSFCFWTNTKFEVCNCLFAKQLLKWVFLFITIFRIMKTYETKFETTVFRHPLPFHLNSRHFQTSSIVLTRLSEPCSRPTTSQKNLVAPGIKLFYLVVYHHGVGKCGHQHIS
jgi:hypothetical protein